MCLILWLQQTGSISGANVRERRLKRTLVCLECLHTFCPPVSHVFRICFSSVSLPQHMWLKPPREVLPFWNAPVPLLLDLSEMARSSRTLINEQNVLLAGSPSPHERVSSLIISGWSKRPGFKLAASLRPSGPHMRFPPGGGESVGPGWPGGSPPSTGGPIKVH